MRFVHSIANKICPNVPCLQVTEYSSGGRDIYISTYNISTYLHIYLSISAGDWVQLRGEEDLGQQQRGDLSWPGASLHPWVMLICPSHVRWACWRRSGTRQPKQAGGAKYPPRMKVLSKRLIRSESALYQPWVVRNNFCRFSCTNIVDIHSVSDNFKETKTFYTQNSLQFIEIDVQNLSVARNQPSLLSLW